MNKPNDNISKLYEVVLNSIELKATTSEKPLFLTNRIGRGLGKASSLDFLKDEMPMMPKPLINHSNRPQVTIIDDFIK